MSTRAHFHLVFRLSSRVMQVVASEEDRRRRRLTGALVCGALDLASSVALARSSRFWLKRRLAVDTLDTAAWSLGEAGHYDNSVLTGVPLAMEAGIRMGVAGFVVPAVNAAATGALRRLRGRPASLVSFRWQVVGVAVGQALAAYEANRKRVALRRYEYEMGARLRTAELAGQHEVAMSADNAVDELCRTAPLLAGDEGSAAIGRMVHAWKASLAAESTSGAAYLGVVLSQWEHRHNRSQADLAADIIFQLAPGDGTLLLTAAQASALEDTLSALELAGVVPVHALDPETTWRPNQERHLQVGDRVVTIPSDRMSDLVAFDGGPIAFVLGAVWTLDAASATSGAVPPLIALPMAAANAFLALWAHREVDRRGESAHARIVYVALGIAIVEAALATSTMRRSRGTGGVQRYPFLNGVNLVCLLLPLYWKDLSGRQRAVAVAGIGLLVGVGIACHPERIRPTHLAAELVWAATELLSLSPVERALAADADQLRGLQRLEDRRRLDDAAAEGRSFVIGLVGSARDALASALADTRDTLDPMTVTEIGRRLHRIGRQLGEVPCAPAS